MAAVYEDERSLRVDRNSDGGTETGTSNSTSANNRMPGAFGVSLMQPTQQRRAAVAEVKRLAQKVLGVQEPPIEAQVAVLESRCPDDGCPDLETTILVSFSYHATILFLRMVLPLSDLVLDLNWFISFSKVFHDDGSTRLQLLVRKPLEEITESDVKASVLGALNSSADLLGGAHGDGSAAAATVPCGCCTGNLEKQRSGCNCCGFVLPEASGLTSPNSIAQTSGTEESDSTSATHTFGSGPSRVSDSVPEPIVGNTLSSDKETAYPRPLSDDARPHVPPLPSTISITVKALVGGMTWPVTLPADRKVKILSA